MAAPQPLFLPSRCQEFKKIFKNDPSVQKLKVIDVWQWTIIVHTWRFEDQTSKSE